MVRCNRELSLGKRLFPEESVFNDLFCREKLLHQTRTVRGSQLMLTTIENTLYKKQRTVNLYWMRKDNCPPVCIDSWRPGRNTGDES
jgi:hypothetical protein